MYAFTGYITGDGRIVGFAGDLVNFVNIDNTALRLFHIIIRILKLV